MIVKKDDVVTFHFTTHRFDTGAATDGDSTPTATVYEDDGSSDIGGTTVTKIATGHYRVDVDTSDADYEAGKWYNVAISATVNSVTGKGCVGTFLLQNNYNDDIRARGDAAWLTGASGAADVSYTYDSGSSVGIVIGDVDAGTIAKTTIADNDPWTIGEVAGTITYPETAGGQGIRVEMTFAAGVGDFPVVLNVWARYAGGAGHQVNVYMYDYVGSGWELVGSIPNSASIQPYSFATHVTHIKNDGEMQCMFHHSDGTGVATHYLQIDKVEVENQSVTTVDANLVSIDGNPTDDNTATLKLKRLDIQNSTDDAVYIVGDGYNGITVTATGAQNALQLSAAAGIGLNSSGLNGAVISGAGGTAVTIEATGTSANAINITGGDTSGDGISISTTDGYGVKVVAAGSSNAGMHIESGEGNALSLKGVDGDGLRIQAVGSGCKGINVTSSADTALVLRGGISSGSADGVSIQAGATDGNGITITTTDGDGISISASGAGKLDINAPNSDVGVTSLTADEVLDEVVEGTYTLRQMIRLMASALCGKVSGGGTTTITFRDTGDTKDRIVATVDSNGNRTAITLTET